nr:unnamed protein product [Digitaria exilis]
MGAIGGDELVQWDKMAGPEAVNGGGGVGRMDRIQVLVRLRPLSEKEVARGEPAEWECINDTTVMFRSTFPDRPTAPTAYTFDRVFHSDCSTKEVYEEGVREVALSVVSGINSCLFPPMTASIFAYGQTSSGKTYTMTGVTEYTVADIYDYINKHEERAFVLKFSAIEIYNEVVRDLLSAENTPLRLWDDAEKGTYVEKLTEVVLRDWNHLKGLISTVESSAREFLGKDKSTTLVASAMEKEIKELKSQRDVAQSRLQNLLQTLGDHQKHSGSGKRSARSPPSIGMPPGISRDDSSQISHDDADLYKEVRCIESSETGGNEHLDLSAGEGSSPRVSNMNSSLRGNDSNTSVNSRRSRLLGESPITLEQHLENIRRPFTNVGRDLGSSTRNSSGSRILGRSRSCRSLSASTMFDGIEVDDGTPLHRSLVGFPGRRPEGDHRRGSALNCDAESETLSRAGSIVSTKTNGACDAEFTGIGEFVAELKEMAQVHYQKQLGGQNANGEFGEGTVKSIGLDPIADAPRSPSRWPLEFEKKQLEIIELWQACSISLVHRTYFFLLFKGDQADSIYMEVELRRLSFLKDTYSRGGTPSNVVVGSLNSSPAASAKKLQREREMLARQMQKRLTTEEREHLYTKWGISLDSKKRKLQVARRLWTEAKDLEHVRESASLVAKLIGLQEPGQVLREMFGLSFAPQQQPPPRRRSSNGWKYGLPSFG